MRWFFLFSWSSSKICSSSCTVPTCTVPSKWQASPMSYKDTLQPVMTGNLRTQKSLFWPKLAFPNCSIDISIQLWTKRVLIEARWAKLLLLSKRSHDDSFSTRQGSRWSKTEPVSSSNFFSSPSWASCFLHNQLNFELSGLYPAFRAWGLPLIWNLGSPFSQLSLNDARGGAELSQSQAWTF